MGDEQKTKILILDDEPIVLKRLKPTLEKSGYEVEAFSRSLKLPVESWKRILILLSPTSRWKDWTAWNF